MKYIGMFDTSIMSRNQGDHIIMESVRRELKPVLQDAFVINLPTHSPLFRRITALQRSQTNLRNMLKSFDLKFVGGTNLLAKDMRQITNQWDIHLGDLKYISNTILVGVGTDGLPAIRNEYTKKFYRTMLSGEYIQSVRDDATCELLDGLGIKAVNTGCATTWCLTPEHCSKIKKDKSESVVFTVTDYKPCPEKDKKMIEILLHDYDKVYCWRQGMWDEKYLASLGTDLSKVEYIPSSLEGYNEFLESCDCDYVGTRLHAGIKAMQKFRRSIILGVDNRARDMNKTCKFVMLERDKLDDLHDMINSQFATPVQINTQAIELFRGQFL